MVTPSVTNSPCVLSRLALQRGMTEKHPLVEYAESAGTSIAAIAEKAGCSRMTLYRIMAGGNTTTDQLSKICAATGGKVRPADFFRPSKQEVA
jgi:transcriptional regulator with XRE-family HTH domain